MKIFAELLLALFAVRFGAMYLFRGSQGNLREVLGGALVLSAPLTLLVVLGNLGLQLGLIDRLFNTTIILLAVVASTVYPFLFKALARNLPAPRAEEQDVATPPYLMG
jgi:Kef-type K+ transport system membrane component KefB